MIKNNKGQELLEQKKVTWIPPLYADRIREKAILGITVHAHGPHTWEWLPSALPEDCVCVWEWVRETENVLVYCFSLPMLTKTPF